MCIFPFFLPLLGIRWISCQLTDDSVWHGNVSCMFFGIKFDVKHNPLPVLHVRKQVGRRSLRANKWDRSFTLIFTSKRDRKIARTRFENFSWCNSRLVRFKKSRPGVYRVLIKRREKRQRKDMRKNIFQNAYDRVSCVVVIFACQMRKTDLETASFSIYWQKNWILTKYKLWIIHEFYFWMSVRSFGRLPVRCGFCFIIFQKCFARNEHEKYSGRWSVVNLERQPKFKRRISGYNLILPFLLRVKCSSIFHYKNKKRVTCISNIIKGNFFFYCYFFFF